MTNHFYFFEIKWIFRKLASRRVSFQFENYRKKIVLHFWEHLKRKSVFKESSLTHRTSKTWSDSCGLTKGTLTIQNYWQGFFPSEIQNLLGGWVTVKSSTGNPMQCSESPGLLPSRIRLVWSKITQPYPIDCHGPFRVRKRGSTERTPIKITSLICIWFQSMVCNIMKI